MRPSRLGALVLVASLASPAPALAQAFPGATQWPDDAVPVLDFGKAQKSVAVRLDFQGLDTAVLESVEVFRGRAHMRKGAAPMLKVDVKTLDGSSLESFHKWHPLVRDLTEPGQPVLSRRSSSVVFPLRAGAAWMAVRNVQTQKEVVTVDLVPAIHDFCRAARTEVECAAAANRAPTCTAGGPYVFECVGPTSPGRLDGGAVHDADGDPLRSEWSGPFGSASGLAPTVEFAGLGTWPLTLSVTDDFGGAGSCQAEASVVDTGAPSIESERASPALLWPPDHKLVPVSVTYDTADGCDALPACALQVVSDEPVDGAGDGATSPDWEVVNPHLVRLRAERAGGGKGRTYTITISCADGSGNATSRTVFVAVPHAM